MEDMRSRRPVRNAVVSILVLTLLAACSRGTPAADLPDGVLLLTASANAMDDVENLRFALTVEGGRPSAFQITEANGVITAGGDVSAAAQVLQGSTLVEYEYIVAGGTPYLKGPTGGFQQVPQAISNRIFNPTGLLAGERSLPSALRQITEATTQAEERVNGVATYRITADLNPSLVEGLALLASGGGRETTLWVARQSRELVKAQISFAVPRQDEETLLTVDFSEFNEPVEIQAPV